MNDKDILLLSATYPINTGPIAPPTGDIIKKEEARLVLFPNPFKDMAKIVGNMMASNTYTKNKAINEIFPKLQHYKIFCVNGNTGFRNESRIFYFIHLQNEEAYERKESSSA